MGKQVHQINMKDLAEPIGKLGFYYLDETTRLEELKYETTILIPSSRLVMLIERISLQQQNELFKEKGLGDFSSN